MLTDKFLLIDGVICKKNGLKLTLINIQIAAHLNARQRFSNRQYEYFIEDVGRINLLKLV